MTLRLGSAAALLAAMAAFAWCGAAGAQPDPRDAALRRGLDTTPLTERLLTERPPAPVTAERPPRADARAARAPLTAGTLYATETSPEETKQIWNALPAGLRSGSLATPLSGLFTQLAADDGAPVSLVAYVLPTPVSREPGGAFVAALKIGVAETTGAMGSRPLSAPMTFQVIENWASPGSIMVDHTGLPYQEITLRPPFPATSVHVASALAPAGDAIPLTLQPTVLLSPDSRVIEGLGLEVANLDISVVGVDSPGGRPVKLTASPSGYFTPAEVKLDDAGAARAQVRSRGVGTSTITASVDGLTSDSADIRFSLPFGTLAACLVGGLIGAALRIWQAGPVQAPARKTAIGVLSGVAAFALYAVGINPLMLEPSVTVGSILVFAVSLVGAYAGDLLLAKWKPAAAPPAPSAE